MNKPIVSIICTTYNQAQYIRQALEGFVTQKTDFYYEAIVADDSSKDETRQIIQEFTDEYPDIIKPIFRPKNIGSMPNFIDALKQARGKYIAICEGDDFWTDRLKLQRQVDFLDENKDHALVFHSVRVFFENNESSVSIFPNRRSRFTIDELIKENFIQTNSVMYRKQDYSKMREDIMPGDWYLHLYHAQFGKIGFIDKTMSAYRRHAGGVWWDTASIWRKYGESHLALYEEVLRMYPNYRSPIAFNMTTALEGIASTGSEPVAKAIRTVEKKFDKRMVGEVIQEILIRGVSRRKELDEQLVLSRDQMNKIDNLVSERESLKNDLIAIKSSRSWKMIMAIHSGLSGIRHPIKSLKRLLS